MAWGNSKDAQLVRLEAQLESKESELDFLRKQVGRLQEALFSKVAPEAYADMQADMADMADTGTSDALKAKQEEARVSNEYLASIEKPFFSSAEDAMDKLSAICGVNMDRGSIHDNEES